MIVGLYGLPGSGKSFLLDHISQQLGSRISCHEGSQLIANQHGDIAAFEALGEEEKARVREAAINRVRARCVEDGTAGIIAGHYSFWPQDDPQPDRVMTPGDLATYTHIIYLDIPAETILQNREGDAQRSRPMVSTEHLQMWLRLETSELREACYQAGILFSVVSGPRETCAANVMARIRDFVIQSESANISSVLARLESIIDGGCGAQLETALVLDADKTIAAEDSGMLFWQSTTNITQNAHGNPLKALFSSNLGYSYLAFRQATLLYEDAADDKAFDRLCEDLAAKISLYPDIMGLLREAAGHRHVVAVVVTCGLRHIWEKVIQRHGLYGRVQVIGGGRFSDGFVVTPGLKSEIVTRLRNAHGLSVWAFGDSPVDVPMMSKADHAIVVVGDEDTRSKSMDAALLEHDIQARQVLFCTVCPRLDVTRLPVVQLTDRGLIDSILARHGESRILLATESAAAKLLMTLTRDSAIAGPNLREAHRRVGLYLAVQFVAGVIGLEGFSIPHVQGRNTSGYRLREEENVLIVALMRAGEPMALGVNDAFPRAMFRHANEPADITAQHVLGVHSIVLVDAVVNNGDTAVRFIEHIRHLAPAVRVVIVAGVVQSQCTSAATQNRFALLNKGDADLTLVALRASHNKFKGVGTTDTGNRLFNTTHLT